MLGREARHQHQRAQVVQQAGRERGLGIDAQVRRQQARGDGRGQRVAPEGLEIEAAADRREAARQGAGRDDGADAVKAQHGDGLRDAGDLRLHAVERGIGDAQGLCRQGLVQLDLLRQHVHVRVVLVHARQQFQHHHRQRGQFLYLADDVFKTEPCHAPLPCR